MSRDVRSELALGLPIYAEVAEAGSRAEKALCVDLLSFSAQFNNACLRRAVAIMPRIGECGGGFGSMVNVELLTLAEDGNEV